jgi:hypothetical protein
LFFSDTLLLLSHSEKRRYVISEGEMMEIKRRKRERGVEGERERRSEGDGGVKRRGVRGVRGEE